MTAPVYVYQPSPPLVSDEQATDFLNLSIASDDVETARHLALMIRMSSDEIRNFLKSANDPTWDTATAPPVVQAAVLLRLGCIWTHRGDDDTSSATTRASGTQEANWAEIGRVLMQVRDPTLV